ncbi:hypothetical protein VM98_34620, partial [Streptomyces rubellomurinus subsp. indigoferus]
MGHSEVSTLQDKRVDLSEKFRETVVVNWLMPEELGGRGLGLADGVEMVNEVAYGDGGVAFTLFIS